MSRHDGKLVLNGAPSQYDRRLRALAPGYARVDGRTPSELAEFAVRFGELVHFYNLEHRVEGTWAPFFAADSLMVLPLMAAPGLERSENRYLRRRRRTREIWRPEPKLRALRQTAQVILDLGRQVNLWLEGLDGAGSRDDAALQMRRELEAVVDETLAPALRTLESYDKGAGLPTALGEPLLLDYSGFLPRWGLRDVEADGSIYRGCSVQQKIDRALPHYDPLFYDFSDRMGELAPVARSLLELSLEQADHKPQIALWAAFQRLFETARETLDTISPRYLRFYYRDVLREPRLPAVPDRLYLTFALAEDEGVTEAPVPRDTLFPAGEDEEGREILYGSDRGLTVTDARLQRLLTLRSVYGDLFDVVEITDPAEVSPLQVERRLWASEISVEGEEAGSGPAWSTLGEAGPVETPIQVTRKATLGFALASPYLLLTGGTRRVEVKIQVSWDYLHQIFEPRLSQLSEVTGKKPAAVCKEVVQGAFDLVVSTAEGWLEIDGYEVSPDPPRSFFLRFTLPASVAPVVPFDPDAETETEGGGEGTLSEDPRVLATNPDPARPTLKAYLRQERVTIRGPRATIDVLPLALLGSLEAEDVEIGVRVDGLSGLTLANTDGEVDPAAPFTVFGGEPSVGSYLEIRHRELFAKTLKTLKIELGWLALPPNDDGFTGWYRDYVLGLDGREPECPPLFTNRTFRGTFSLRNPGTWLLEADAGSKDVYLFRAQEDPTTCRDATPATNGALCPETGFRDLTVRPTHEPPPEYYDPAEGAVRLELTQPSYAFGSSIYPLNVLNAVVDDLPDPDGCLAQALAACAAKDCNDYGQCMQEEMDRCMQPGSELKYPNEPYLPQAETLRVHYEACCGSRDRDGFCGDACGELYHLEPFGGVRQVPLPRGEAVSLLPSPPPGNLYLGFSRLPANQRLPLLFDMVADGDAGDPPEPPPVAWEILSENRWVGLGESRVLEDGTHGFENTGLVALDPPPHDPMGHAVLPAGYQWLRAGVEAQWPPKVKSSAERRRLQAEALASFPKTAGIFPHAVVASWRSDSSNGAHLTEPLPAHTITESVEELPDVGVIDQPLASFGGRPAETRRGWEVRLGERLRHKDRAILGWDYERLVLERFPEIWKVRALPTRNRRTGDAPGDVLMVVVPGLEGSSVEEPTVPRATGELLRRIEEHLAERASPFVDLAVTNPAYVRIRVMAQVVPADGSDAGDGAERLNRDLIEYLSPAFYDLQRAARGGSYAFEPDITEFVRTRPYVAALRSIGFTYDPAPESLEWYFLTSARKHSIEIVSDSEKRWDDCRPVTYSQMQ